MSRVRVHNFSIRLTDSVPARAKRWRAPFGHAGTRLHEWFFPTRTFCAMQGELGGSTGIDDLFARDWAPGIGVKIMGRFLFGFIAVPGQISNGKVGGATTLPSTHQF